MSRHTFPLRHLHGSRKSRTTRSIFALGCTLLAACVSGILPAHAEDVSAPAMLQMFEAKWDTIQDRQVDLFEVGYGGMWLPAPYRADSGDQSVGYDVYDRFDLGRPRKETLYGTETSFSALVDTGHRAGVMMYPELLLNHNGFSDLGTVDDQGTPSTADDVTFAEAGGYPGFAVTLTPSNNGQAINDIDGDFHGAFEGGDLNGRLAGLIDIAQEKNYQFIRHPVASDPMNLPAGTMPAFGRLANVPDANNAQYYPDQGLGGTVAYLDAAKTQPVTLYDFNGANPLAGDAVVESAEQLLARHARWMVQKFGVDGFRVDAAKHFPNSTMLAVDQALHNSIQTPLLDGSRQNPFLFSEVFDGNKGFVQSFIRKDIGSDPEVIGGNRDALDFPLFFELRNNLTSTTSFNNWHGIRNASQDTQDDGLHNGSQGVAFVDTHDNFSGGVPFLKDVAYAYTLMMPGQALVYLNAKEFGEGRSFPNDGKDDALGGFYGDAISTLISIRNTHGRGNFRERWIDDAFNPNGNSKIYVYERSNAAIVALSSRNDTTIETRNGVQTDFAPNTILVELTGNAADPIVDPGGVIPETVKVNGSGQINVKIPGNGSHGHGYVIYGLPNPEGTLSLTNVATTLAGATPTAANNGTARLADIDVIHTDSFDVQLATTPVSVIDPGTLLPVRDFDADGDSALLKIDGGLDLNNLSGIDNTTPGSTSYGFEEFTDTNTPGYIDNGSGVNIGTGTGAYAQTIDATQLSEGRHYITTRSFRHRDDGGPAVFTEFKRAVYIDRLPPEAAFVSFDPFASSPTVLDNRDLIVQSVDKTADNMHIFLDLAEGLTDAQIITLALGGQQDAGQYDVDSWIFGFFGVTTGNHVATVVTFEPSFDGTHGINVQRFPGLLTTTGVGVGFGDLDADNTIEVLDLSGLGNGSFEDVLYSQNTQFNAAADVDGDGDVDNLDLFVLGAELVLSGADQAALDAYDGVLLRRGDINQDGQTDRDDVAALYASFGGSGWLEDLNVDGTVDVNDVETLITALVQTEHGDFDLDGDVDGGDFVLWQVGLGIGSGGRFDQGDADLNGAIDAADRAIWEATFGFSSSLSSVSVAASGSAAVPEPNTLTLLGVLVASLMSYASRSGRVPVRIAHE